MKSKRIWIFIVVTSLSTMSFAQADFFGVGDNLAFAVPFLGQYESAPAPTPQVDTQKTSTPMDHAQKPAAPKSEAQVSFNTIKSLAGEWEGAISTDMSEAMKKQMGAGADIKPLHLTMRVTSRGNVLVHEFQEAGTPLDATKYDHPVTMLYVDADKLNLVHYCDAGNRPRMIARTSPDGKTMEFDFADLSGSNKYGHMYHAIFTLIDANHHTEEWTYMTPGDKPIHAKFDLHRVN